MRCKECGLVYRDDLSDCPKCHPYGNRGKTDVYRGARGDNLSISSLFKGAFRSHPKGAGAKMFMAGTPQSTPSPDAMLDDWEVPWLYARIMMIGLLFVVVCFFSANAIPALVPTFLGAGGLFMPLSILVFYWEVNIPRDIPLYKILMIFFIGGLLSIAILPFLSFLPTGPVYMAPFREEPAKIIATAIFIYWIRPKYIFGGMLIGAAVGAGFAAFETIGYNFSYGLITLIQRAVLAIGGHVTWAAIEGGALVYAMGGKPLGVSHIFSGKFLPYVAATMVMHFVWNFSLHGIIDLLKCVLLCVVAVYVSFTLIDKAIKQVLDTVGTAKIRKFQMVGVQVSKREVVLTANAGPLKGNVYPFTDTVTIGRDPSVCQIILPADTSGVSRKHCTLKIHPDGIYIMDFSSKGTYLRDGTRLPKNEWVKISGVFCLGSPNVTFSLA